MKKKKTKQFILDKSLDIFSKNSFFSVSMQDLANCLEIKKSLIYYYFDSKSKLYKETVSKYFKKLIKKLEIIFSQDLSSSEKINKLAKLYLQELEKDQLILSNKSDKNKLDQSIIEVVNKIQKNIIKYFELIVSEGVERGEFKTADPKKSSLTLIGYLEKIKQHNLKLDQNWFDFIIK